MQLVLFSMWLRNLWTPLSLIGFDPELNNEKILHDSYRKLQFAP